METKVDIEKTIQGYEALIDYHIQHLHKLNEDLKLIKEIKAENDKRNS